ncbi:MAG: hypothetical protein M0R03_16805 [Novosphingobium sp.]|nr:hypothetical protein [Novosphingobium sp.]
MIQHFFHEDIRNIFDLYPIYKIDGFEFSLYPIEYISNFCVPNEIRFHVGTKAGKFKYVKFDTWRKVSNEIKKFINTKMYKITYYNEDISIEDSSFEITVKYWDLDLSNKKEKYIVSKD